jgi:hypothetical protein
MRLQKCGSCRSTIGSGPADCLECQTYIDCEEDAYAAITSEPESESKTEVEVPREAETETAA